MHAKLSHLAHDDEFLLLGEYPCSHTMWLYRNVTVTSWFGKPEAAAARALGPLAQRAMERNPGKHLSNVHLIAATVELPDAQTRAALMQLTQDFGAHTACVAVLIGGAGFKASALRGIVTSLSVIGQSRAFDIRAFGTVESLLHWLPAEHTKRTGVELEVGTLARLLEQLRV